MPANKSHHYVPQMYMRLFSDAGDKRVGVFALSTGKFIPNASIKGQACKDYFYGRGRRAEPAFGNIEGRAAAIFEAARRDGRLPHPVSEDYEWLMFFLAIQHSRTMDAEAQHNEAAEKVMRSMLRRKAELEGNERMLEALELVKIKRTNGVADAVRAATIGASLLTDLALLLVHNDSEIPFVASDAPVVTHNRMFEAHRLSNPAGYASVGLQLILPLGPRLVLLCYDAAAYDAHNAVDQAVRISDPAVARVMNDLQWEAADRVLFAASNMPVAELGAQAIRWGPLRIGDRTIFREEIVEATHDQVRTRFGVGAKPSIVPLDLPFLTLTLPCPAAMGPYERAPVRNDVKVAKAERAFDLITS